MIINYILVVGCLLDLLLTYNYLKLYKEKFPTKDYTVIEANPLIRYFIRTEGLRDGLIVSGAIILAIVAVFINLSNSEGKWFLAGAYYMMITFHITNFLAFKRLKIVGKEK